MLKNKKQKKELLIVIFITVLLSAGVSDFLYSNPQIKFVVSEFVSSSESRVDFSETDVTTYDVSVDELKNDKRVVFDCSMMLINNENPVEKDYPFDLLYYKSTEMQLNSCVAQPFDELSEAVSDEFGNKLYVSDGYRTADEQERLEGDNKYAAPVDASEHQAGLALDVYVQYHAGKAFLKSEEGRFVNQSCWQYGFIIRYPYYGKKKTGIEYEPWHIRYVGAPHAEIIYKNRLTLEEYISGLEYGKLYKYGEYIVERQNGKNIKTPLEYRSAVISPDNCGGYICTFNV